MKPLPLHVSPESTDPFDQFFMDTHGGTGEPVWEHEEDSDECEEDNYDDKDEL